MAKKKFKFILVETTSRYDDWGDPTSELVKIAFEKHIEDAVIEIDSDDYSIFHRFAQVNNLKPIQIIDAEQKMEVIDMFNKFKDEETDRLNKQKEAARVKEAARIKRLAEKKNKAEEIALEKAKQLLKDKGLLP